MLSFKLPEEFIWLTQNATNGGYPNKRFIFPIADIEGYEDGMILQGLYGIGRHNDFDFRQVLKIPGAERLIPRLFPLGYDASDGHLFIVRGGDIVGQIRYLPLEEIWDESIDPPGYFVANSVKEFTEILGIKTD
jgi:hypothetical protein